MYDPSEQAEVLTQRKTAWTGEHIPRLDGSAKSARTSVAREARPTALYRPPAKELSLASASETSTPKALPACKMASEDAEGEVKGVDGPWPRARRSKFPLTKRRAREWSTRDRGTGGGRASRQTWSMEDERQEWKGGPGSSFTVQSADSLKSTGSV